MIRQIGFHILCFAIAVIAGCARPDVVSISGSTTLLPAVSTAAQAYQQQSGASIIVNAGGSGSGFNQLAEGQTDIGMMSRDITDSERANFAQHQFSTIAIGRDAVVPVISSEIYAAGVTEITPAQIAAIYSGKIDNWQILGGPDQAIFVIDKEVSSGTRQTFMQVIMGDAKAQALGADLVIGSNNEEQTALTQSDAAIGMLSLAWLNKDVKGLSLRMDDNRLITPDLDRIRDGSYPIARDLNLVIRQDISPKARAFIDYILSPQGQVFVEQAGYVAVSP